MNPRSAHRSRTARRRQGGLSLLELLVAFVIMAFSLAALYRASGGTVRGIAVTEQHQRAAQLVQSLLESRDSVPPTGWHESGERAGLRWQVSSAPYPTAVRNPQVPALHEVSIVVHWPSDGTTRQLATTTLLPQGRTPPGGVVR